MARAPIRGRTIALTILAIVLAAVLVRASGWTPIARDPLPVTEYAPHTDPEPSAAQTLAHGTFEAGGGEFAWEVFGYPEMMGSGVQPFRYHVQRIGGEPARVWPMAARMLDARGDNLGETPLGDAPSVEGGVIVVRQGFQPRVTGAYQLTAEIHLEVVRVATIGFVKEDALDLRLAFESRSVRAAS